MGCPIYVLVWKQCPVDAKFYYVETYGGRSWFKALNAMLKAKREGFKCIKLEWRP